MVAISYSFRSWQIVAELPYAGSLKDVRDKIDALQIVHWLREVSDFAIVFGFRGYRFRLEYVNGHVGVWGNDESCPVGIHLAILGLLIEALRPQQ
ncbi:MAG: hypothetical protein JNL18_24850 [Planctomycetaceae bacterium]|uniref:Uncharacterized protein n=1 Tax=Lacipirellula limnantheis TaxID=2528024 RepID=A0A517TTS5_9BACT|nr:hypothetical protein [Lacipirellula limnantheis]MBL9165974.1 hypothetical protein [Planctomycetaceae bacterium]QDT71777.1 hypothetical protein I41_09370 [Lacipirellula limnantheis]